MSKSRLLTLSILIAALGACGGGDSLDDEVRAQFGDTRHALIARGNEQGQEWRVYAFDDHGSPGIMRFGPFGGGSRHVAGFEDLSGLDHSRNDGTAITASGAKYSFDSIDGFGPPEMVAVRLTLKDGTVYRVPAIRVPGFEDVTFFVITGPGLGDLEFQSIKALDEKGNSLAAVDQK